MKVVLISKLVATTVLAATGLYIAGQKQTFSDSSLVAVISRPLQMVLPSSLDRFRASLVSQSSVGACTTASTSYPWGKLEMRTWTPRLRQQPEQVADNAGGAFGLPFDARLVTSYGRDLGYSHRTAVFETADGCRSEFRTDSFSAQDIATIEAEVRRRPFPVDPATYTMEFIPDVTTEKRMREGTLRNHRTQHFTLWFGTKTESASYRWARENGHDWDGYVQQVGAWLEYAWSMNQVVLNAPMPFANSARKRKLDIFICGTGLPWYGADDEVQAACGPSAGDSMQSPLMDLAPGSTTAVHELGHMIQFHSGGFRARGGPIWEVGAEWNSFVLSPASAARDGTYFSNLENGPLFSNSRYAAYPFMEYIYETDSTRDLVWRTWRENRRDTNGDSQEDFVEALVRLGQGSGAFPHSYRSFGDFMGWYGARLVSMDFVNRRALLDSISATKDALFLSHLYTPLATVASARDPKVFAAPASRSLLQWGTHIVPLTPSARRVAATLTGGTKANGAAWRVVIVSVGSDGKARYSPLGSIEGLATGSTSMDVPSGAKTYLAITATPSVYESLEWQQNGAPTKGTKFPYRVKIDGAMPFTGSASACNPNVVNPWNLNYNTNGFLADGKPC